MDYQTKQNLRNWFIRVRDELANENENMGIFIECSKVGTEMLGDMVEWSDDVAKLEEKPFGIIIGTIKDTDIPVALSEEATITEYHIFIRIYRKNDGIPFEHLRFEYLKSEKESSDEQANEKEEL